MVRDSANEPPVPFKVITTVYVTPASTPVH